MQRILENWFVKWVLTPIAVLLALSWGYIQINYPTCVFRYKLTAEVMTPDGLKSGSSVIEVSYSNFASLSGVPNLVLKVVGEANYIDLGSGKNLFILLTNRISGRNLFQDYERPQGALDALTLPLKIFNLKWHIGNQRALNAQLPSARAKGRVLVPFESSPTLVVFGDLNQPDTVEVVQPASLSKILGSGYELKSVVIEITDEYSQQNIEKILPWLDQKRVEWENKFGFGVGDPILTQLFYDSFKQPYIRR
jgi:hypothetical protein